MKKRLLAVLILCVVLSLPVYFIGDAIISNPPSSMFAFVIVTIGYTVVSVFASCFIVTHDTIKKKSFRFKLLLFFVAMLLYVLASWASLFILLYIIGFFALLFFGINIL